MAEDLGEKTEAPTGKKLADARAKGRIAKSTDLSAAFIMLGATVVMLAFGFDIFAGMTILMRYVLEPQTLAANLHAGPAPEGLIAFWQVIRIVAPVALIMLLVAYIAQIIQVGFLFTLQPLEPKLSRLNVIAGMKKFFSKRSLVKLFLDLGKLALIGGVVILCVVLRWEKLIAVSILPLWPAIIEVVKSFVIVALWVLLVLFILGVLDYIYQRHQHTEDLKMTKHEVKDERKSTDGDPEMKGRRMRMARQIAMQRLQTDVPKADVIVTNPTHFSVALKYDSKTMGAPRVVAKGGDYLALKIRYIAAAHGVPIIERPPLARALYRSVEVGQEVHAEHYEAVAEVLAYVYRLEGRMAS